MTANQIMFPLIGVVVVVLICAIWRHNKKQAQRMRQATHRPNTPNTGVDKAEIARSAMSGMMGRDR